MKFPQVSIIILNWNGWRDTLECLESLSKISYFHYEVIIVDNASKDDSVKRIKAWAKKKLIKNFSLIENDKNYGFAEGNNIGIRKVLKENQGAYILILNNDTVVNKKFLKNLIKIAESQEKIGIVGPKIYLYPPKKGKEIIQSCGADIDLSRGNLVNYGDGEIDQGQFEKARKVGYVYGTCFLVKSKVFKKVGFFDKKYHIYAEEADFCLRAKKAGYSIYYVPQAIIWHKGEASFQKKPQIPVYLRTRNLFWLERKFTTRSEFLYFLIHYFLSQFPRTIWRSYFKPRKFQLLTSYLRGLRDGIWG